MAGTYGHDARQVDELQGIYGPWLGPSPWLACKPVVWPPVIRAVARSSGWGKLKHPLQALLELSLMLHFPKGVSVPKAYRHPHFLLLPPRRPRPVVGLSPSCARRNQLHQLFRPDDVASPSFSLSQHAGADLGGSTPVSGQALLRYGLWSPDREPRFWGGVCLYPSVLPGVEVELFFWKVAEAPLTTANSKPNCAPGWRQGMALVRAAPAGRDGPLGQWPGDLSLVRANSMQDAPASGHLFLRLFADTAGLPLAQR